MSCVLGTCIQKKNWTLFRKLKYKFIPVLFHRGRAVYIWFACIYRLHIYFCYYFCHYFYNDRIIIIIFLTGIDENNDWKVFWWTVMRYILHIWNSSYSCCEFKIGNKINNGDCYLFQLISSIQFILFFNYGFDRIWHFYIIKML